MSPPFATLTFFADSLYRPYDIITISTTVKSLPDIEPLAEALPLMLKPEGRRVYQYTNTWTLLTSVESSSPISTLPSQSLRANAAWRSSKTRRLASGISTYNQSTTLSQHPANRERSRTRTARAIGKLTTTHVMESRLKFAVVLSQTILGAHGPILSKRTRARCHARASFQGRPNAVTSPKLPQLPANTHVAGISITARLS